MKNNILIIEDEKSLRQNLTFIFEKEGFKVTSAGDGTTGLDLIKSNKYHIVLCDIQLPGIKGLDILKEGKEHRPDIKFIIMTAYGSIESAVEAIKYGAEEYVTKPFSNDEIIRIVDRFVHIGKLEDENKRLKEEIKKRYELKKNIIGHSEPMQRVFDLINRVARVNTTVLVSGETGTGKELISRAIHSHGDRATGPFIPVNCAAIPENLFESELFGYEKGAFTGATNKKIGLFQEASGGTILLDEISEIPLHLQGKLLRVLQEKRIRPVGSTKDIAIDVNIISASNRPLEDMVTQGSFREDLYYRIRIVEIKLPPLRERGEDISPLVDYFINKYSEIFNRDVQGISSEALDILVNYNWPGNVRQLEHAIQSAMVLSDSNTLGADSFSDLLRGGRSKVKVKIADDNYDLKELLNQAKVQIEEDMIKKALNRTRGNAAKAAELLGISHRNILYKIKDYHIVYTGDRYD